VSSRTESSGGQFWKRLRFTTECSSRRIRIKKKENILRNETQNRRREETKERQIARLY
jgi:hypothetical protein